MSRPDSEKRPVAKAELFRHCHEVYMERFSKEQALDHWDLCFAAGAGTERGSKTGSPAVA